jgi:hypothetical protein
MPRGLPRPPPGHFLGAAPPPLPPSLRTNWIRLVPPSVLTGHVSSTGRFLAHDPPGAAPSADAGGTDTRADARDSLKVRFAPLTPPLAPRPPLSAADAPAPRPSSFTSNLSLRLHLIYLFVYIQFI